MTREILRVVALAVVEPSDSEGLGLGRDGTTERRSPNARYAAPVASSPQGERADPARGEWPQRADGHRPEERDRGARRGPNRVDSLAATRTKRRGPAGGAAPPRGPTTDAGTVR